MPSDATPSPKLGPDELLTELAGELPELLDGRTMASAESFTAGLISQSLASVGGSGDWFHGGIVAYRPEIKHAVLGVADGPVVTESCAVQMAQGAAERFGTDVALATTGVAGPGPEEGRPPGTVVIGWCIDGSTGAVTLDLAGTPETLVRRGARAALEQLGRELGGVTASPEGDAAALADADASAGAPTDAPSDAAQPSAEFSREELPSEGEVTVVEGGDPGDGGD
jgi:nicotinamide-nucleotide amidase